MNAVATTSHVTFPTLAGWERRESNPCPLYYREERYRPRARPMVSTYFAIRLADVSEGVEGGFRVDYLDAGIIVSASSEVFASPSEAASAFPKILRRWKRSRV